MDLPIDPTKVVVDPQPAAIDPSKVVADPQPSVAPAGPIEHGLLAGQPRLDKGSLFALAMPGVSHTLDAFEGGVMHGATFGAVPNDQQAQAHPWAAEFGNLMGAFMSGKLEIDGGMAAAKIVAPRLTAAVGRALAPELSVGGQAITAAAKLRNVARLSATGAAAGGVAGAPAGAVAGGQQDGASGILPGAATGAGEGAAVGGVLGPAVGLVTPPVVKAVGWVGQKTGLFGAPAGTVIPAGTRAMAKSLNMSVGALQAAHAALEAKTGEPVSLFETAHLANTGDLAMLAKLYPPIGQLAEGRRAVVAAGMPRAMADDVNETIGGTPDVANQLIALRSARGDAAMADIRETPITLSPQDEAFLTSKQMEAVNHPLRATPDEPPMTGDKLNLMRQAQQDENTLAAARGNPKATSSDLKSAELAAAKSRAEVDNNPLTLDDIDVMRKGTAGYADTLFDKNQGQNGIVFRNRADRVGAIGKQVNGYGDMLDQWADDSKFINGYKHGTTGQGIEKAPAGSADDISTPRGFNGFKHGLASHVFNLAASGESGAIGLAERLSQDSALSNQLHGAFPGGGASELQARATARSQSLNRLNQIAPGAPQPTADSGIGLAAAAHALRAVSSPTSPWFWYHAIKAATPGLRLTAGQVQSMGKMLADRKMAPRALAALRAAGASSNAMRQLSSQVAPLAGAVAGEQTGAQ